jgi:hypothetical protein
MNQVHAKEQDAAQKAMPQTHHQKASEHHEQASKRHKCRSADFSAWARNITRCRGRR